MAIYKLTEELWFPPVKEAVEDGLLAIGGDLSPERLVLAYQSGIFPWFDDESQILWWSPDPRFVLYPEKLHVSSSMKVVLKRNVYRVTYNIDFKAVIENCRITGRKGQRGTWITSEMKEAYIALHNEGFAHSVEVWFNDELVGGLYGVLLGNCFFGESMFSKMRNASKTGFITFVKNNHFKLIDCQVYTSHLESLGAEMIPRGQFIQEIQ